MGYTERNWKDASILVCNDVNGTLDIKFSEIKEAIEKDYVVMVKKTVDGVTTFLDIHTINPTERTLNTKGWIYTATSDEAYATGEADESGEGGGSGGGMMVLEFTYTEDLEGGTYVADVTKDEFIADFYNYTHIMIHEEGEPDIMAVIGYRSITSNNSILNMRTTADLQLYGNDDSISTFWYQVSIDSENRIIAASYWNAVVRVTD